MHGEPLVHAQKHVALEPKQEQLLTLVPISLLLKLKSVPIPKDIMAHGLAGLFAVQHVAADTKHVANLTHVAVKIMSKRELVTKIPDIMVPGVNGVLALLHVVVVMLPESSQCYAQCPTSAGHNHTLTTSPLHNQQTTNNYIATTRLILE